MNASPFRFLFILFLLSTCHGEEKDVSPASDILAGTKGQKNGKTSLEVSCPEPADIEPCKCENEIYLSMDCSKVQDEEQLRKVFSAFFPNTDFYSFRLWENTGVKVLEDGVFGSVSFQDLDIWESVLETVRNDALTSSLNTLTRIAITYSQLAIFPFERLAEFTSLRYLYVDSNNIQSFPPLSSSSLQFLHLNYNPISQMSPDVFTLLPAIKRIQLAECHLTVITPGTFKGLPELDRLNLTTNKISYLQSLTFDLAPSNLKPSLDLSNNTIDYVEVDAFKGVQEPSTISMAYNSLTRLMEDTWRPVLERGINVELKGNDLSCGCDVAWLVRDPQLLTLVSDARCADGTLLTDLNPDDFDTCG